jgi:hypothetical protein
MLATKEDERQTPLRQHEIITSSNRHVLSLRTAMPCMNTWGGLLLAALVVARW